jgi:hypothetical protein
VKKHTTFTFSLNNQKKPPKMIWINCVGFGETYFKIYFTLHTLQKKLSEDVPVKEAYRIVRC